jgi:hypothetical protein
MVFTGMWMVKVILMRPQACSQNMFLETGENVIVVIQCKEMG